MSNNANKIKWPELARALRLRVGASQVHSAVWHQLSHPEMKRLLVACSGGPDSVFMLCLLWADVESLGLELVVAHYNHRWRGLVSDQDAQFVREMAESLGCSYVEDSRPENEAAFTETTARALRLDFLRSAAAEHACSAIAFGHQQNDILETQLQRLARGSGSEGLAAPRPVHVFAEHPTHVRPLLGVRAGDIRLAMAACRVPWCEDSSNNDLSIPRNALRSRVVPLLLDALGRDASAGAGRSRALLEEDAEALNELSRQRFAEAYAGIDQLNRADLQEAPKALSRRALTAWLHAHELIASMSAPAMDQLVDAVYSSRRRHLLSAGAAFVVIDGETLLIEPAHANESERVLESATLEPGETVILSNGSVIETDQVELDPITRDEILSGQIEPEVEAYVALEADCMLEVRAWQPGDRFKPIGAPGSKKLKDWFIDRRIPQKERKHLPVVCIESGEIIWVPGFAPAERFKLQASNKQALRLTYQSRNPL
ncbi:MAG: tRNA lysidine(34) synthetase TilS [Coraliomargarita sp.]